MIAQRHRFRGQLLSSLTPNPVSHFSCFSAGQVVWTVVYCALLYYVVLRCVILYIVLCRVVLC